MFISFEGPDGSGKTTQIAYLAESLESQGFDCVQLREPGSTEIGEKIRNVLHDNKHTEMDPSAELLLYSASRAQIVAQRIRPSLAEGKIVLIDRFFDSTYAYQGYGHGLDMQDLRNITEFATKGLTPDLTFLLDLSAEEGLKRRLKDKNAEWNRLDNMALEFHKRVRAGYLTMMAEDNSNRWVMLDANRPIDEVRREVGVIVEDRLRMRGRIENEITSERQR